MSDSSQGTIAYSDIQTSGNIYTGTGIGGNDENSSFFLPVVVDDVVDDGDIASPLQHHRADGNIPVTLTPDVPTHVQQDSVFRGRPSVKPATSAYTERSGAASAQHRGNRVRRRPSSLTGWPANSGRTGSAKRSAGNDGDSSVVQQKVASAPDGGGSDPSMWSDAVIEGEGPDFKGLKQHICELEEQVAGSPHVKHLPGRRTYTVMTLLPNSRRRHMPLARILTSAGT